MNNKLDRLQDSDNSVPYPFLKRGCVTSESCIKMNSEPKDFENIDMIRKNYGVINKNKDIREKSSSGGVFTLLATYVLEHEGVVYGAVLSKDCNTVFHTKCTKVEELEKLRTSKYVQSKIQDTYKESKSYLDKGVPVLFTGTPCQISGLKRFLGKDYSNLITQDIVCHGVPSPMLWIDYIKLLEQRFNSKVKNVNFRYKQPGARFYSLRTEFESGEVYCNNRFNDLYLRGYLSDLFLRPSCYNCYFKGLDRLSDITLADFWGVNSYDPEFNNEFGVSLVTVHTEKGLELLKNIKKEIEFIEVDDKPLIANSCSIKSTLKPNGRDIFWNDYNDIGNKVFDKYFSLTLKEKIKKFIKKLFGK